MAADPAREREPEPEAPPPIRRPSLDCTPVKALGYRGGHKFPITVVSIDGRFVERATADAYWAMQSAAAEAGIELPIFSGFRSQAEQQYFYRC